MITPTDISDSELNSVGDVSPAGEEHRFGIEVRATHRPSTDTTNIIGEITQTQ